MRATRWIPWLTLTVWVFQGGLAFAEEKAAGSFVNLRAPYPPNIILIVASQLRVEDLGCYGFTNTPTPSIDLFAAQGMRFTRFFTGSPQVAPAQAALLTGLHTGHLPLEKPIPLPLGALTLQEFLKDKGYRTGGIGNWALGAPETDTVPLKRGFDDWIGHLDPAKFNEYHSSSIWRNERVLATTAFLPDLFALVRSNYIRVTKYFPFFLYHAFNLPGPELVQSDAKPSPSRANRLQLLDREVGALIRQLQELDLDQVTAVILTSDTPHAPALDDSSLPSLTETNLHAPLLVRWPTKVKPALADQLCAGWDLFATLAQMAQTNTVPGTDGISLLPVLLETRQTNQHDHLFWRVQREDQVREAVRVGDWHATRAAFKTIKPPDTAPDEVIYLGPKRTITKVPSAILKKIEEAFDKAPPNH